MWWVGKRARRSALAYVGEHVVRVAHGGTLLLASAAVDRADALQKLADGIALLPRGCRVQAFVSGAISRPFLMPQVAGAQGASDWAAVATAVVKTSTGLPSDSAVWMDDGQSSPRLAVAMHSTWKQGIERTCGSKLESLKPWWALALDRARAGGDARHGLAVFDSDELVLLVAEGATYVAAQTYALRDESADSLLRRALITNDLAHGALDVVRFSPDEMSGGMVDWGLPFGTGEAA